MPRIILIIIGWLSVALGTLGVFLPLLFGGYLRHWQQYRAMPPGAKPRAVMMILLTFAISLWLVNLTWVRILLLIVLACLLIFMWRIPVVDAKQQKH